ncbi:MAG: bifunctional 4-hydroxy-2-oxoglutarate aldolase/2-dehydro-3-deoxy-phosphogluconate aldolase [Candidatus Omnitrophica bacterium]|nr:bifunctional 4-hydroxy-2-oxoglutarate aldolase/2-dehydro-3-deoxy-phosphogluconate aldolase [Candidatus Omnitrophota bacterium]
MDAAAVLKFFEENKFVAVIRTGSNEDAEELTKAVTSAGIKIVEITMTIPQAGRLIENWSKQEGLLVGAGTVTDGEMAQRAINAGARFLASHYTDRDVISVGKNNNAFLIQGAVTPTEAVNAWQLGADLVRVYPAEFLGGPAYLRALRGPLPFVKFMAGGEIPAENVFDYLKYCCAVTITKAVYDKALVRAHHWAEITERVRQITQKLEALKVPK